MSDHRQRRKFLTRLRQIIFWRRKTSSRVTGTTYRSWCPEFGRWGTLENGGFLDESKQLKSTIEKLLKLATRGDPWSSRQHGPPGALPCKVAAISQQGGLSKCDAPRDWLDTHCGAIFSTLGLPATSLLNLAGLQI